MGVAVDIEQVAVDGGIRVVFQPIVRLSDRAIIGYEALARGPLGTPLEQPAQLFAQAREHGLLVELDWECQRVALRTALDAGLGNHRRLFINVDPAALVGDPPVALEEMYERAAAELSVVIEVTERDLDADPAAVIARVAALRRRGFAVALDDVGADPMSLAFLPLLAPDVIKLDMGLVRDAERDVWAEVGAAVGADAEDRGATILGEGIETEEHAQRVEVLGATLGQGWLFGHPGDLKTDGLGGSGDEGDLQAAVRRSADGLDIALTPWSLVEARQPAIAPKRLLQPISRHIEQMAHSGTDRPVVLGAFQRDQFFSSATAERYARLVGDASLVAAFGEGMSETPAEGVRGASLASSDRLVDEWVALTISPYRAAAVIGKDLGDAGPDSERRFAYVITHDRSTVGAAARSLMQYLAPIR